MYLYVLNETYTNDNKPILLNIVALISIICGIFIIISNNPIVSVISY